MLVRREELAHALMSMHGALAMPETALEQGEALARVLHELLALLGEEDGSWPRAVHPIVDAARAYIHAHWCEDFTLDELGRAIGFSVFHLVRTFRKQIGMPPSAYRRALRVRAAQRLLRAGTPPARAAAAECGFYDQAHLNRHFKRVTGVTPAQYMRAELPFDRLRPPYETPQQTTDSPAVEHQRCDMTSRNRRLAQLIEIANRAGSSIACGSRSSCDQPVAPGAA